MPEFERLLDNFGRLHEAAGEAGEAQAWGTVKKRLSDAEAVERRLISMWDEAQIELKKWRDEDATRNML